MNKNGGEAGSGPERNLPIPASGAPYLAFCPFLSLPSGHPPPPPKKNLLEIYTQVFLVEHLDLHWGFVWVLGERERVLWLIDIQCGLY